MGVKTVRTYQFRMQDGSTAEITVEVDMAALAEKFALRAVNNKTRKVVEAGGRVVVRASNHAKNGAPVEP